MNIHIETPIDVKRAKGFSRFFLPILQHRFGVTSILLFLILVVTEDYYLNLAQHEEKETYIFGDIGSGFAVILIALAIGSANRSWNRYYGQWAGGANAHVYLNLTDEYVERGVSGVWHQQLNWRMLESFKEREACFVVQMTIEEIVIKKRELPSDAVADEIRVFLRSKVEGK
ncbi:MAG: hypothetical protein ABSA47_06475 [Verrucomicrobiota bacterium]|jgi:hypothetical protein